MMDIRMSVETNHHRSRSNLISHDLEAALQYDEERRRTQQDATTGLPVSPYSPFDDVPFSLPPPPRGSRRKTRTTRSQSLTQPSTRSGQVDGGAESDWNPYINRAPVTSLRARREDKVLFSVEEESTDSLQGGKEPSLKLNQTKQQSVVRGQSFLSIHGHLEEEKKMVKRNKTGDGFWHKSRSSSASSSASTPQHSESSHEPFSTDSEPRISISSTIYAASSDQSHPNYFSANSSSYSYHHRMSDTSQNPRSRPNSTISTHTVDSFIDFDDAGDEISARTPTEDAPHVRQGQSSSSLSLAEPVRSSSAPLASSKPPVPSTPKPTFYNRSSASMMSKARSTGDTPPSLEILPPTTNTLNSQERADLIRKSRKLTQMLGQTPGPGMMQTSGHLTSNKPARIRHQKGAISVNVSPTVERVRSQEIEASPVDGAQYLSMNNRRHSNPLTPDEFTFLNKRLSASESVSSKLRDEDNSSRSDDRKQSGSTGRKQPDSPTSFIDLSEEEYVISPITKHPVNRLSRMQSSASLLENMTPEERADEERRRKREKLARLHRFLGSRVPTDIALGIQQDEFAQPSPDVNTPEDSDSTSPPWLRRRRSSSAAAFPTWSDNADRMKSDYNEQEKARNVKRAQKMEKVFGVAPPQKLYTRHVPSPSTPTVINPVTTARSGSTGRLSLSETSPPPTVLQKNRNQTAYKPKEKSKGKKMDRPSTAESTTQLLHDNTDTNSLAGGMSPTHPDDLRNSINSIVYSHYQHSLKSLNDIIDRDDRESLMELHQFINPNYEPGSPLQEFTRADRRLSNASSVKSDRRRSLPARTSLTSLASEYTVSTPGPDVSEFETRRRKAAKLTQFFGVDYTVLISDVIKSIETGVQEERRRGTLNPREADDLMQKVRSLNKKTSTTFVRE